MSYLTIPQFLEEYPMGRSTLYRLAAAGQLTITKFGRSSRIALSEAERWAASLPMLHGANDNDRMKG